MTAQPETTTPDETRVQAMAHGYIRAWLDEDYWTIARIVVALQEAGATMEQVAEVFSLVAACLLTEAHGGSSHAASGHVSGRQDDKVAKRVRQLGRLGR
jgi:hypothetical protein